MLTRIELMSMSHHSSHKTQDIHGVIKVEGGLKRIILSTLPEEPGGKKEL